MLSDSSPLLLGLLRGTIFFALVILFEIFWGTFVAQRGPVLTAGNIVLAGFAASAYVLIMHFIDQKREDQS